MPMSPMRLIILLIAAAAAVGAGLLMRNYVPGDPAPQQGDTVAPEQITVTEYRDAPQTPVLVATRDLSMGELLGPNDIEWRDWPDKTLSPNYVVKEAVPDALERFANSVVRSPIYKDEPIRPEKIVRKGETGYMAALLDPGMRAVSVEISTDNASGGFILPNDRVDVMVTYEVELTDGEEDFTRPTTTTILQNVRVLAIDQLMQSGEGGTYAIGSTATLELEPRAARLLVMAEQMGDVSLALRSARDAAVSGDQVKARTDFLIDVMPYQTQAAPGGGDRGPGVNVYRNGRLTETAEGGS